MHLHTHIFFFNDTATTEIYTLSLHDALPIYSILGRWIWVVQASGRDRARDHRAARGGCGLAWRSEEHTSELQSRSDLVCRLLLEKKNKNADIRVSQECGVGHSADGTDRWPSV